MHALMARSNLQLGLLPLASTHQVGRGAVWQRRDWESGGSLEGVWRESKSEAIAHEAMFSLLLLRPENLLACFL